MFIHQREKMATKSRIYLPRGKYKCIFQNKHMNLDQLLNIKEDKDLKLILNYLHNEFYEKYNLRFTVLKYYYKFGFYREVFWPCLKET